MPRHDIEFELPRNVVLNSDVRFVISSDGQRLGEPGVSRGSIAWTPSKHSTTLHLEWEQFDDMMRDSGRPR